MIHKKTIITGIKSYFEKADDVSKLTYDLSIQRTFKQIKCSKLSEKKLSPNINSYNLLKKILDVD